ncbi:MAG: hypothetical protein EOP41_06190 [Sphingobacteriaceae bacterium]|nr:MAG: hypothetical protein EOP41_06190 [Sphingobacteriaceae bacterium]
MKTSFISLVICFYSLTTNQLQAQSVQLEKSKILPVQVDMSVIKMEGKATVRVVKDAAVKAFDQPTFARINPINFKNGVIEVKVLSRLLKNAPDFARGFIGIAFRINADDSKFECIYIRPTNSQADDQVRRNHTVQYFSFPDFSFERLRKESPEKYETRADVSLNQWTKLRIEVAGKQARLFINNSKTSSFIVNDLKLGPEASGAIGLWVDVGTEGFFKELKIYPGN